MKKLAFASILICFSIVFLACQEGDTVVDFPTEPAVCGDKVCSPGETPASCPGDCDTAAPGNNSAVFAQAGGVCPAAGPCIADFSVSLNGSETVSWVFTGGQPPTSTVAAGQVRWPGPGTYNWTSSVCKAPTNCTSAQGAVAFSAP